MDMPEDVKTPIILGRPCLTTASTLIDVASAKLVMSSREAKVESTIRDVLSAPVPNESMYLIDIFDVIPIESKWAHEVGTLQFFLEGTGGDNAEVFGWEDPFKGDYVDDLELYNEVMQVHEIEQVLKVNKDSSRPLEVEMKTLFSNLKYTFLRANSTYPIIVNSELNGINLDSLVNLLRKHRKAIRYTNDEIKGISPSICTHRINLEPDAAPSTKGQRRLNPNLKEVVKKEVLKLLNVGIIYPNSDSKWVSQYRLSIKRAV